MEYHPGNKDWVDGLQRSTNMNEKAWCDIQGKDRTVNEALMFKSEC